MNNRINIKFLEAVCARINHATGSPEQPYVKDEALGHHVAQIGNYHIAQMYNGVALHRMYNEGGAINDVFRCGSTTKRQLADRMFAYLEGLEAAKESHKVAA